MTKRKQAQLKAFEQLFRSNYGALFPLGFRLSADRELTKDMIQSLFLDLWEKGGLPLDVRYPAAYLQKAFHRKMINELKKQKGLHDELTDNLNALSTPSYEELLINFQSENQRQEELHKAIQQLPQQMREMLSLRFLKSMSYDDIATQTGKSKQTVYNQIYEAIKKLKNALLAVLLVLLHTL